MLKQTFQQKLLQKLSPQQIQLMKLLQIPTTDLEQRIKDEIEENPALEEGKDELDDFEKEEEDYEDDSRTEAEKEIDVSEYLNDDDVPDYKAQTNNYSADDEIRSLPLAQGTTFGERLETQLSLRPLSDKQRTLAETILGNLDDDGYLRRELSAMVDDLAFTANITTNEEELEEVLFIIQDFEPKGIAARNLQECLVLQLEGKSYTEAANLALMVLDNHFEAFTKKHYNKIIQAEEVTEEELKAALDEILKLNPKPGNSGQESSKTEQAIIPDFIIENDEGNLTLSMHGRNSPQLRISKGFKEMLTAYSETKKNKEATQFVKQKIDSAKWFIEAIQQRNATLQFTMGAIMEYQEAYFLSGDETKLRPMILKDIAEKVGMDISTISRVANSKYVQTDFGTFLLKSFFSESLTNDEGEEVSTIEVKKILQESIGAEDKRKPLTDEKLMNVLKEKGYNIARRTVAKYREQLDIPVARLRKEL
jgi:RNA polymerase sigma-54 factor